MLTTQHSVSNVARLDSLTLPVSLAEWETLFDNILDAQDARKPPKLKLPVPTTPKRVQNPATRTLISLLMFDRKLLSTIVTRQSIKKRVRPVTDVRIVLRNGVITVSRELEISLPKILGRPLNTGEKDFVIENFRTLARKVWRIQKFIIDIYAPAKSQGKFLLTPSRIGIKPLYMDANLDLEYLFDYYSQTITINISRFPQKPISGGWQDST